MNSKNAGSFAGRSKERQLKRTLANMKELPIVFEGYTIGRRGAHGQEGTALHELD